MHLRERKRDAAIPDGVSGEARVMHKELTWLGSHTPGQADKRWRLRLAVSAPEGGPFELEHVCTIPWDKVRWINLGLVKPTKITFTVVWRMVMDDPFTVNETLPTW